MQALLVLLNGRRELLRADGVVYNKLSRFSIYQYESSPSVLRCHPLKEL